MAKIGALGLILYLIFGLYFLNIFFNVVPLPISTGVVKDISLIAGIFLIVGGIFFWKANRYR